MTLFENITDSNIVGFMQGLNYQIYCPSLSDAVSDSVSGGEPQKKVLIPSSHSTIYKHINIQPLMQFHRQTRTRPNHSRALYHSWRLHHNRRSYHKIPNHRERERVAWLLVERVTEFFKTWVSLLISLNLSQILFSHPQYWLTNL